MGLSTNRGAPSGAGVFATTRRGALSQSEIEHAKGQLGSRATPSQVAKMLGRCEADVRAIMYPEGGQ